MNVLLVDDERLARRELRRLLQPHADVTIVGEAANADEAAARLAELPVDLMCLDVQMPGTSGFDLLEQLPRVPLVIFTTAFDEYAVRAFDVNAFDYLLKPIKPERLSAALDKARRALAAREAPATAGATKAGLPQRVRPSTDRVFVRDGDRCWIVALDDIALFEGEGNYTRLYFDAHRPLIRTSLASLEARLDPAVFFRASRRHIVNLRMIEKVEASDDDNYTVRLRNGSQVPVSRRQSKRLRDGLSL
jgi:two-component system LytT family response regulator